MRCKQSLASPTSPQFRVKRERRALKPLFPSNAADILSKSDEAVPEEGAHHSPEATIAQANEGEEPDSASLSGSDYSREEEEDSDADDGRSNFGLDVDADTAHMRLETLNGVVREVEQPEDDGDVTMRLREQPRTPSAGTPNGEKRVSKDSAIVAEENFTVTKKATHDDEEYLSELSEDEAFAASLA